MNLYRTQMFPQWIHQIFDFDLCLSGRFTHQRYTPVKIFQALTLFLQPMDRFQFITQFKMYYVNNALNPACREFAFCVQSHFWIDFIIITPFKIQLKFYKQSLNNFPSSCGAHFLHIIYLNNAFCFQIEISAVLWGQRIGRRYWNVNKNKDFEGNK